MTRRNEALFAWRAICDALAAQAPWWEPGTQHGYHAVTFGHLVGEVVRRVDGRTLGRYFREELAQPLGLDFHIGVPEAALARPSPRRVAVNPSPRSLARLYGILASRGAHDGSIAFADPDAGIGFAYVMNQMQAGVAGDPRGYRLIRALYGALA